MRVLLDRPPGVLSLEKHNPTLTIPAQMTRVGQHADCTRPLHHARDVGRRIKSACQLNKTPATRLCVVGGAVGAHQGDVQAPAELAQLVAAGFGVEGAGEIDRVDLGERRWPAEVDPRELRGQKALVKRVVVRDGDRAIEHTMHPRGELGKHRRFRHIFVLDPRDLARFAGNRHLGVAQELEGFRLNATAGTEPQLDPGKLDDPMPLFRVKASGLGVEGDNAEITPIHPALDTPTPTPAAGNVSGLGPTGVLTRPASLRRAACRVAPSYPSEAPCEEPQTEEPGPGLAAAPAGAGVRGVDVEAVRVGEPERVVSAAVSRIGQLHWSAGVLDPVRVKVGLVGVGRGLAVVVVVGDAVVIVVKDARRPPAAPGLVKRRSETRGTPQPVATIRLPQGAGRAPALRDPMAPPPPPRRASEPEPSRGRPRPEPTREIVLVIDPVDITGRMARLALASDDRDLHHCTTGQDAMVLIHQLQPDVVVAALDVADLPGLRLLQAVRQRAPSAVLLAIAGTPTVEGAVQALRAGAVDYIGRPVSPGMLSEKVARALGDVRAARQLSQAQRDSRDRHGFSQLLSRSPRMLQVFDAITAVAPTDATVLIRGETGTGKELVARALHEHSPRSSHPLIGINCGAFTETLLESELFGHEKGSFTGAIGKRQGVFEMADRGSLFLDELGETSLSVQVNLLRVLEEMAFRRVGGTEMISVDVRIIAATNVHLEEAVRSGRFREDLFYRLNVYPITLPPLRERTEDIPLLMRHFLDDAAEEYEIPAPTVPPETAALILRYRWPGNVRQLRALCERWVIQCRGAELRPDLLPAEIIGRDVSTEAPGAVYIDDSIPLDQLMERVGDQVERAYLHRLLLRHRGHLQHTAAAAGTTRRTLYTRMKKLGLDAESYK